MRIRSGVAILVLSLTALALTGFAFEYEFIGELHPDLTTLEDATSLGTFLVKNALLSPSSADASVTASELVALLNGPTDASGGDAPSNIGLIEALAGIQDAVDDLDLTAQDRLSLDDALQRIDSLFQAALAEAQALANGTATDPDLAMLRLYAYLVAALGYEQEPSTLPGIRYALSHLPDSTLYVRVGDSIQDAIDRVMPGGTIYLSPGVYALDEQLLVGKSLELARQPGTGGQLVLTAESAIRGHDCIVISNQDEDRTVVIGISGITLTGGENGIFVDAWGGGSIALSLTDVVAQDNARSGLSVSTGQIALTRCVFEGNGEYGIVASRDSVVTLTDCAVSNNGSEDAALTPYRVTAGIYSFDTCTMSIRRTDIIDNDGTGLRIENASAVRVETSTIAGSLLDGILLWDESALEMTNSRIEGSGGFGIRMHGPDCVLAANEFPSRYFSGTVTGSQNIIFTDEGANANNRGRACPDMPSLIDSL